MASHLEHHFEALERPKSPTFAMDYDAYHGFDYLHFSSPFNVNSVPREYSLICIRAPSLTHF